MLTAFVIMLVALIAGVIGYLIREIRETLKRIDLAVRVLVARQKKEELAEKKMGFATPMTMEELNELEEEEKIEALNS